MNIIKKMGVCLLAATVALSTVSNIDVRKIKAQTVDSGAGEIEPLTSESAIDVVTSGIWENNIEWKYNTTTGTLAISGDDSIERFDNIKNYKLEDCHTDNRAWKTFKSEAKNIIIEDSVHGIGNYAFYEFSNLETVEIRGALVEIGEYAFANCTKLKKVLFPYGTNNLKKGAFSGCSSLVKVECPGNVGHLYKDVFKDCINLTKVSFGAVDAIELNAFYRCKNLKRIDILETLEKIDPYAFNGCKKLKQIKLPKNIVKEALVGLNTQVHFKCVMLQSESTDEVWRTIQSCFQGCKDIYYDGTYTEWSGKTNKQFYLDMGEPLLHFNDGTKLRICKPAIPEFDVRAEKKAFKIIVKKGTHQTGIDIRYQKSGDKKWKTKSINTSKSITKTIGKLKADKYYKVKVRSFRTEGGITFYSDWSDVLKIRTN